MRNKEIRLKGCEIVSKLSNKWQELCKQFYVCYSVEDLAYKISYELLEEFYGECNNAIFCKCEGGKWNIAIYFEQEIYFTFDIWWQTRFYGDTGLHIGNGIMKYSLEKNYTDIQEFFGDNYNGIE